MKKAKNIIDLEIKIEQGTVITCSDIHFPFQDDKAVNAFINFVAVSTPEYIVLNGDLLDMYMLSRFTKGEGRNPFEEMQMCKEFLKKIREVAPKAKIFYTIGNHETRLEKTILSKAPELESLFENVFQLLKLEDLDIRGCARLIVNNDVIFKHGTLLGNKSGLSAIKEMENAYSSGVSGHTHRLCKYIARKAGRKFFWIESGCLCRLDPEYMVDPNWQQGFAEITFIDGRVYDAKVIEIEDGVIL